MELHRQKIQEAKGELHKNIQVCIFVFFSVDPKRPDDCGWSRSDGLSPGAITFQHCDRVFVEYIWYIYNYIYIYDIIADAGTDGWSHLRASRVFPLLCCVIPPFLMFSHPKSIYNIYRILDSNSCLPNIFPILRRLSEQAKAVQLRWTLHNLTQLSPGSHSPPNSWRRPGPKLLSGFSTISIHIFQLVFHQLFDQLKISQTAAASAAAQKTGWGFIGWL